MKSGAWMAYICAIKDTYERGTASVTTLVGNVEDFPITKGVN